MADDPRDKRWEERADRAYTSFTDRPIWTIVKWFMIILAVCLVLGVIGAIFGWIGSWGEEAGRITGPQNTREQTTQILNLEESMVATAQNTCAVKNSKKEENDPSLIEDPALAYAAQYRNQRAEYNRRMKNLFEAAVTREMPLPAAISHLPREAPTLEQRQAEVC